MKHLKTYEGYIKDDFLKKFEETQWEITYQIKGEKDITKKIINAPYDNEDDVIMWWLQRKGKRGKGVGKDKEYIDIKKVNESYSKYKIYHYTSFENALKIIESGELIVSSMSPLNKYGSGMVANDYGYVSFTTDEDFEISTQDIICDVRFIFDEKKLDKKYDLVEYSYDEELYDDMGDVDDLTMANTEWYGDEEEVRIYKNVSLVDLISIERVVGDDKELEAKLEQLCKDKGIKYIDNN